MVLNFSQYLNESSQKSNHAAGVAIIYDNKILLVHPTGASWKKGSCGIPKGRIEQGEDLMESALRELEEETGIRLEPAQLNPEMHTVDSIGKDGNRQLIYFVAQIQDLSEIGLDSERVPKDQLQIEEIDWAKFVSPMEAYPITSRSQLIILDRHLSLKKN